MATIKLGDNENFVVDSDAKVNAAKSLSFKIKDNKAALDA